MRRVVFGLVVAAMVVVAVLWPMSAGGTARLPRAPKIVGPVDKLAEDGYRIGLTTASSWLRVALRDDLGRVVMRMRVRTRSRRVTLVLDHVGLEIGTYEFRAEKDRRLSLKVMFGFGGA